MGGTTVPGRAHELSEIQRDTLRCAEDGLLTLRGKAPSGKLVQEPPLVLVRQRAQLEHDLTGIRVSSREELVRLVPLNGPQGGDDEDGVFPRDLAKASKGVERARVAPVQVLQAQHDLPGTGRLGRERSDGREGVEPRCLRRSTLILGARFACDETIQGCSGLALHHHGGRGRSNEVA